jgi:hypothetical protein
MKAKVMMTGPRSSMALFGAVVALGSVAGCVEPTGRGGTCDLNAALSCGTILAGNPDAGVDPGLVGYTCNGLARPDDLAKYVQGVPQGQICADMTPPTPAGDAPPATRDYCCTPAETPTPCAYNPVAICPEGYGYQCRGPNRPEVLNTAITCGNGVREGDYINYCCQHQPRPVGCTQAKGAFDCTGGLIGWVCPEGYRPRGEDFGMSESRADYYYFVCGVPTPAPNPAYSTYCCFTPSPVLPGGSCVYSPGSAPTIPNCGAKRFAFACYGRDTPDQDYYPRIVCPEPPVSGLSDDKYAAQLYCCDYVPPGQGTGAGTGD